MRFRCFRSWLRLLPPPMVKDAEGWDAHTQRCTSSPHWWLLLSVRVDGRCTYVRAVFAALTLPASCCIPQQSSLPREHCCSSPFGRAIALAQTALWHLWHLACTVIVYAVVVTLAKPAHPPPPPRARFLCLMSQVEETCSGAVACQLVDSLFPGKARTAHLNFQYLGFFYELRGISSFWPLQQ